MKYTLLLLSALIIATAVPHACADDFAARCADREAIERVYHGHRLGTKQPFEQAMPRALIEQVVKMDQCKEALLKSVYGVEVTPAMVDAEVQRIHSTTRAPEVLAEIKRALGDDVARFAASLAQPIIVERDLRRRFDADDTLHAPQRREAEHARESLIAGNSVTNMHDVTWKLTGKPDQAVAAASGGKPEPGKSPQSIVAPAFPTQAKTSSRTYTNEATVQLSQVVASPDPADPGKDQLYFEDLDPQLQSALRAQLQKPGDVSTVVETPGGFTVFLAREKTNESLTAASLTIVKRSYEEWLDQGSESRGVPAR